jgi:hypothetical protein
MLEKATAPQTKQCDFLHDLAGGVLIVHGCLGPVGLQHILECGVHDRISWFFSANRCNQRTDGLP